MSDDVYININGLKGIWTLEEVIRLFQENGLKVKIVMSKNGDSCAANSNDPHISTERR